MTWATTLSLPDPLSNSELPMIVWLWKKTSPIFAIKVKDDCLWIKLDQLS
jgi:hypothetical protein